MKSIFTSVFSKNHRLLSRVLMPVLFLCAFAESANAQTYCTPSWASTCCGFPCTYGMSSVYITGYSGSRLADAPSCSTAYLDRTGSVTALDLQQGFTYNDTVNSGYGYYETVAIWIDYNNDGNFSTSELVSVSGVGCCSSWITQQTSSFTVPLTAPTGTHRMRVRVAYNAGVTPDFTNQPPPCSYYWYATTSYEYMYYGNCRDYNVNIVAAPACSGTPTVTTVPAGTSSVCSGGTLTYTGSAGIYSGLSYQWQENVSGTWTNISGATSTSYTTPGITTCRYFRMQATCAASTNTGSSAADTACPGSPSYATLPYEQDFESWQDYCKTKDVPDGHWKNTPAYGSNSWRREDQGGLGGWAYPSDWGYDYLYYVSPTPAHYYSGSHAARFHGTTDGSSYGFAWLSYLSGFTGGFRGDLDLYVNCSGTGNKLLQFYYQNPAYPYPPYTYGNNDSMFVYLSTDGGTTFSRIWSRDSADHFAKVQLQITSTSATTIIRFEGYRGTYDYYGYGYNVDYSDMLIDSVYVGPPCNSSFNAGTISPAGPISACAGGSYALNLSGTSLVGGLTYQWKYANAPFTTFNNVTGATAYSVTTPPVFDSVQYEVAVTCPYTSTTITTTPVSINLNNKPGYAAINLPPPAGPGYHYSFENWGNRCGTSDAPLVGAGATTSNWANYPYTGDNSWRREDQGSSAGWYYPYTSSTYCPSPLSKDSSHSARFYSYYRHSGYDAPANMYLFLNCSTITGNKELQFYAFAGASPYGYNADTLKVNLSTDGGITFSPLTSIYQNGGWNFYRFPVVSNAAKTIIQFQGKYGQKTYDDGPGMGLDGIKILPPCQGMPTAGTVSNFQPCSGKDFTLNVTGTSQAAGLAYQWLQSTDGTTWTSVVGDTAPNATFNITAPTYYRVVVTCTNSGQSDTSAPRLINLSPFYYCYCDPSAGAQYPYVYRGFGNFSIVRQPSNDTVINNGNPVPMQTNPHVAALSMYGCGSTGGSLQSLYGHTNYDTMTPRLIYLDSLYRIYITPGYYCNYGYYSGQPDVVWIDYNHNAAFDPEEIVFSKSPGSSAATAPVNDTFRVPDNAMIGITGMRVMDYLYNYNSPVSPCYGQPWHYGEIQDYLINVNYRPCNGPVSPGTAFSTDTSVCEGYGFTLVDTTHENHQSGISWVWQQSPDKGTTWVDMTGTTMRDTVSQFYSFGTMGDTSWYRVKMQCLNTGAITYSDTVKIHKGPHYECYCYSIAVGGKKYDSSDIGAFTIGGYVVNKRGPHILNPAATGSHTNYTGTIIDLDVDSTYPLGVYHILRSAIHADGKVTMFIDYNNNFQYDVPEERVWTAYTTATDWYITNSITIPNSVITDVPTGMRVIINNNTAPNIPSDEACGAYTSGETMDFVVRFNRLWPAGVGTITGMEDLMMYPNPTSGKFTVQFNADKVVKDLNITVTDMTGRQVLQRSYQNTSGQFHTELDMSGEPRGMYFVTFMADGERMIRKLVLK